MIGLFSSNFGDNSLFFLIIFIQRKCFHPNRNTFLNNTKRFITWFTVNRLNLLLYHLERFSSLQWGHLFHHTPIDQRREYHFPPIPILLFISAFLYNFSFTQREISSLIPLRFFSRLIILEIIGQTPQDIDIDLPTIPVAATIHTLPTFKGVCTGICIQSWFVMVLSHK